MRNPTAKEKQVILTIFKKSLLITPAAKHIVVGMNRELKIAIMYKQETLHLTLPPMYLAMQSMMLNKRMTATMFQVFLSSIPFKKLN